MPSISLQTKVNTWVYYSSPACLTCSLSHKWHFESPQQTHKSFSWLYHFPLQGQECDIMFASSWHWTSYRYLLQDAFPWAFPLFSLSVLLMIADSSLCAAKCSPSLLSISSACLFPCAGGNPNSRLTAVDEVRCYVTGRERARQPALTFVSLQSSNQGGSERQAGAISNIYEASAA